MPAWILKLVSFLKQQGKGAKIELAVNNDSHKKTDKSQKTQSTQQQQTINFNNTGNVFVLSIPRDPSPELLGQLREQLLPSFEAHELSFIEEEPKKLIHGYKDFSQEADVVELKDFFDEKIPSADLRIMETGLYVNYLLEHELPSNHLKAGVIRQYGTRGKSVINLASAGYYKSDLMPLYKAMSSLPTFEKAEFDMAYEKIVAEQPFTIFVNSGMSSDVLIEDIRAKVAYNLKYGVDFDRIAIHGYGKNAQTIKDIIPQLEEEYAMVNHSSKSIGGLQITKASVYYR